MHQGAIHLSVQEPPVAEGAESAKEGRWRGPRFDLSLGTAPSLSKLDLQPAHVSVECPGLLQGV